MVMSVLIPKSATCTDNSQPVTTQLLTHSNIDKEPKYPTH